MGIIKGLCRKKMCDIFSYMSSDSFKIVYGGENFTGNKMDIKHLAPSLLAFGEVLEELNKVVNNNENKARVNVKAFSAGSFCVDLEVVTTLSKQLTTLVSGASLEDARHISQILFGSSGLLYLILKSRGQKPKQMTINTEGNAVFNFGDNSNIEVDKHVANSYNNLRIRQNLETAVSPLESSGVDEIRFQKDDEVKQRIRKGEYRYFKPQTVEDKILNNQEYPKIFEIVSVNFREDQKWKLSDGNKDQWVKMSCEDFLVQVENGLGFAKGDKLDVVAREVQTEDAQGNLKTEYEIVKVKNHLRQSEQQRLF